MSDNVRFVYVTNGRGRMTTVAYQYNDAAKCIHVATSECSPRDRFVKKIGRDIAFNRLVAGKHTASIGFAEIGGDRYSQIAQHVASNVDAILRVTSNADSYITSR